MRSEGQIINDILKEIEFAPWVESTEIDVAVKDGTVTLAGTANSYLEVLDVVKAAKSVKDVQAVVEDIKISAAGGKITLKEHAKPGRETKLPHAIALSATGPTRAARQLEMS